MRVIEWLLDADPSVRWQVMRDLTSEPADVIAAERARVATEGWGAQLLALQAPDGHWGGRPWSLDYTDTFHVLELLRRLGLDPQSDQAQRAIGLVREHVVWRGGAPVETPWSDHRFFEGEVEPCINGNVVATGSYFGVDMAPLVERLLGEQLPDGGWNCEVENGATVSSFGTTINVVEGLLEHERAIGGSTAVSAARRRAEAYMLERRLFRRKSTGEVIDPSWLRFSFPTWWHYDILRGLDYLRVADVEPDERIAEAIGVVEGHRDPDGRWPLQNVHAGEAPVHLDEGEGRPSRWNTLRAMRVLAWYGKGG
jgi:prenyltransferase/squalene oxidase-like repeat protein